MNNNATKFSPYSLAAEVFAENEGCSIAEALEKMIENVQGNKAMEAAQKDGILASLETLHREAVENNAQPDSTKTQRHMPEGETIVKIPEG